MNTITTVWVGIPFFLGFMVFLVPRLNRHLAFLGTLASAVYGIGLLINKPQIQLNLLNSFGVTLVADQLSGYFILTNAVVTIAVVLYCWKSDKNAFFYAQVLLVHGSLNAAFICADFISLYVALEVSGIAAFLLIAYSRSDRSIWVGLRYLFVSNISMLFYLMGAVLIYEKSLSFSFSALKNAPPEAIALILLGLLVKAGVFVSGLWLPVTHAESETPVSAILSGIVVKASLLPLLRCAAIDENIYHIVVIFGAGTALMGVYYAILEKDTKRMLAFSTISQLGFILAAPEVGGFYALTHGMVKSSLFLIVGSLPTRNFKELQSQSINTVVWIPLVLASLSISGFPLLAGFPAKVLTLRNFTSWQFVAMNVAALGTAIFFAKFIFLPHKFNDNIGTKQGVKSGFWIAVIVLIAGLFITNIVYLPAYNFGDILKAIVTTVIGWLIYHLILQKLAPQLAVHLPHTLEKFEHLVGVMSLTLIFLFGMALS
ncbi:putative monovalent cation/H+ antiporter subunit D [Raphidiopsis curvata NIES-932]|nr:putative monovalent cation/H+ antiporter subunit D [Raphidiopsis curvata NIES-932]